MNDPYAVLGLSPSASEEEVKRAYRALVKKYHPDNYVNNPLADLAEAKMKEINEAYDAIVKGRTQGGYQQQAQSNGNRYGTGGQSSQNPAFLQVRQLIVQNNLAEAERILRSTAANSAEWYFLMGSIAYRRGWLEEAKDHFSRACQMDPGNPEYSAALNQAMNQGSGVYGGYRPNANMNAGGCNSCDVCSSLICADCCCECMGGDLISCC